MGITDVVFNQYQQVQGGGYPNKPVKNSQENKEQVKNQKASENTMTKKMDRFERTSKIENYDITKLSKGAQDYLAQLKEKYNMADVIVADYHTDEEANQIMSTASKDYAIVITPDMIEKMASDEEAKTKYEGLIDASFGNMDSIKEQLGEDADKISKIGMSIDAEGKIKYFAVLDSQREQDAKRLEEQKEAKAKEKAEKKKEEEKERINMQKHKTTKMVTADSMEELIRKIKESKLDEENQNMIFARTAQEEANKGAQIDFAL